MINNTNNMNNTEAKETMDPLEIARFAQHAEQWWQPDGAFKTLHDINPTRLDWICKYITPQNLKMLDIGCGGGILTEGLAKLGANITGLDVEEHALKTARAHAEASNVSIEYVCEPVELFDGGPFDAITCLEMFEHVEDPEIVIRAAVDLLKPGGYLFLSTVNRTAKAYATVILGAEYILSLLPRQTHSFERFIRPSELASSVRQTGLDVMGVTGLDYNPFSRESKLQEGCVDVNYLLVAQKPV
ncbi:MAG: bifunctional 2-polyprenyl-6-hydroxyphenol methylase/3-demethylubiquinol 3-O-methyltransferase UbiG [Legionellaceae bacterium]|nr:bifunctional 2-polyprenyl-6-hydroxyphenol methylase/3-demethylubiquinol 3-O-methyltransferase UbiG [Legionellaceae bacterium]